MITAKRRHDGARAWRSVGPAVVWPVRALSVLVAAALLVSIGYGAFALKRLNNGVQTVDITVGQPPTVGSGGTSTSSAPATHRDEDGKDQNILVVGNDDRSSMTDQEVQQLHVGRDGGSLNTDTMMIVHAPADGSAAVLISLPRDTYVDIPHHGMDKLNAAYADGYLEAKGDVTARRKAGANLLIETVSTLTGLTIDHFVSIGLLGFYRITNALHGVPVTLCNAIDGRPYTSLVLPAGRHRLDGVQALEFVRQRHGLGLGDLDRDHRQRYFVTAAFREISSSNVLLNPGKIDALISAVDRSLWADKHFNIVEFASQVASLNPDNIDGDMIPFVRFDKINGSDVNIVDPVAVRAFVSTLIDGSAKALAKAKLVAPSTVSVQVLDASGSTGTAKAYANVQSLARAGFAATAQLYSGARQRATTIEYPVGMESQAKTLARYVGGASLERTGDVSAVTLLLGSDGKGAGPAPAQRHVTVKPKPIDSSCIK